MPLSNDFIGETFGYLTVIGRAEDYISKEGKHQRKWNCRCVCGKELVVYQRDLTSGKRNSCGCKKVKKSSAKNVVGEVFGELTVIDELPPHITPNGSKQRIVKVKCTCGKEYETHLQSAKKNKKCTDCLYKERRNDISGQRFGKLTVLSMAEDYVSPSGFRLARCNCICDCGNKTVVNMSQLVTGGTTSCGCLTHTRGFLKDYSDLMEEYDYEKNTDVDINTLTAGKNKKIWWKCKTCNNSWYATVASRTDEKHHGCPYCSGLLTIEGKNDLLTLFPEIASEWNYEKNKNVSNKRVGNISTPNKVSPNSSLKVWWKCNECGYEWKATVANRTGQHSGCPKCNIENVNSFCEQAFYYYVKQLFPDAINSDTHIGMELDIFIPSINTAIEYDGEAWHNSIRKEDIDSRKNDLCIKNGVRLLRIREPRLSNDNNCICFFRKDSTTDGSLSKVIIEVLNYLSSNNNISVDVSRDSSIILEQYATKKYENSLEFCHPEIAKEWHPTKNGLLTPDKISRASRRKVWWLGKCGHEYMMPVSDRTITFLRSNGRVKKQYGCPYCSGKRLLKGFNDLESQFPEIAKEWHPTKNGSLTPDMVLKKSSRRVWWQCSICGNEYQKVINDRVSHSGCPYCYQRKKSPPVICCETGIVYQTGSEAAKAVGIKYSTTIYRCCRGEVETASGFHWKFAELNK